MNKKHIEFRKNEMKVQLTAQTLSTSVAKSMIFLKNNDIEEFKDASATAESAQIFNDLNTALNTGNKRIIYSLFELRNT